MTLLEAIQNCGDNWFRPVSWGKSGYAFRRWAGGIWVMDKNGNKPFMIFNEQELIGQWETVTPEQVMGERK